MTLAEDFTISYENDGLMHDETADVMGATLVDTTVARITRWGHVHSSVYALNGEFVKVTYEVGSSDSDIDYSPEFTDVRQTEVSRYVYVKY